jgi:hypothetical protein
MIWVEHLIYITGMRNDYEVLVGKPEGKKSFGRCRHRLESTIKIDAVHTW